MKRIWMMSTVMLIVGMVCNAYAASAEEKTLSAVVRIRSVFHANTSEYE